MAFLQEDPSNELYRRRTSAIPAVLTKRLGEGDLTAVCINGETQHTLFERAQRWLDSHQQASFRAALLPEPSARQKLRQKFARVAQGFPPEEQKAGEDGQKKVKLSPGVGVLEVEHQGETVFAVFEEVAKQPFLGAMPSLVLAVKGQGRRQWLQALLDEIAAQPKPEEERSLFLKVYRYDVKCGRWTGDSTTVMRRSLDSVLLPPADKARAVDFLRDFLSEPTMEWHARFHIPYKCCLLFHGAPGSGKTSMIKALASEFDHSVCFLQPTHKDMTDEVFQAAIKGAPEESILVLEDVDALFDKDRKSKTQGCPLTFSGLLNGLDGMGSRDGMVVVMTTNFVDRLDPALTRSGRVNLPLHFAHATDELVRAALARFYPEEAKDEAQASAFVRAVRAALPGGTCSMADLQQLFVQHRQQPLPEVVAGIPEFAAQLGMLLEHAKVQAEEDAKAEAEAKAKKAEAEAGDEKERAEAA